MRHAMWLVPVVALVLTVSAASAETVIGMGIFGGVGIPSGDVTDAAKDTKTGLNMGIRMPLAFGKMFSLEPFLDRTEGKPDQPYIGTLDGMDMTAFGINVGLGRFVKNHGGFHLTPFAGIMNAKMRRENGPGDDQVAWQAGLAIGLHGSETTHWDIRGAYVSVPQLADEPGKRNYINVSLGLTAIMAPR